MMQFLFRYWIFGKIMCELWLATDVLLCTASILNLCLISLDRYWSITRAISYVKQRTKQRAMIMIGVVWVLSMIICFPPLVGWKRPQPVKWGYPLCVLSDDLGYIIYSTLGSFYIPLIIMVIVYIKIYLAARARARRTLKKEKPKSALPQSNPKPVDNGKHSTDKKTPMPPTTTTSFTAPQKVPADNKVCSKEFDSLEEEPAPLNAIPEGGNVTTSAITSSEPEFPAGNGQVVVPMSTIHYIDEKRKLLASELEDTDSACESPAKSHADKSAPNLQDHSHLYEETDSTSDAPSSRKSQKRASFKGKVSNEENLKPLLEDSQLESDCDKSPRPLGHRSGNNNVESKEALSYPSGDITKIDTIEDPKGGNEDSSKGKSRKIPLLSPSTFRKISLHVRKTHITTKGKQKQKSNKNAVEDLEARKKRLARARERRANLVLGIVMGTFITCWLPFFSCYLISVLTGLEMPPILFAVFFWGGYCNSALNPIIYTIFNREFKLAFQRLLCGKRGGR